MKHDPDSAARSFEACLLLDFYGNLLTERTRGMLELHFDEDISLSEIAEQMDISRQAVHDGVARGLATLEGYERKLGLIGRFRSQRSRLEEAIGLIGSGRGPEAIAALETLKREL